MNRDSSGRPGVGPQDRKGLGQPGGPGSSPGNRVKLENPAASGSGNTPSSGAGSGGGGGSGSGSGAGQGEGLRSRRNRIRYNCTTCREKKLKCNRGSPCDQCLKRNIGTRCTYVPYVHPRDPVRAATPRSGRPGMLDSQTMDRIRHLESLVTVLRRKLAEREGTAEGSGGPGGPGRASVHNTETPSDLAGVAEATPAGALMGTRYVDAANWEGIMDDITKTTTELQLVPHDEEEFDDEPESADPGGPILFTGSWVPMTVEDLLVVHMPARATTDRLVARFFAGKEPAWLMFHVPSFMRQYDEFWKTPTNFNLTWVGLIFIMISHASFFCMQADEEVPGQLGPALEVMVEYRRLAAQCLALDDFTTPGKYKVEAMILYFGIEYLRKPDAQRSTSILISIIVRLAMHSGLHREPSHYKDISVFEGEMRRRLWTVLVEIDLLVSFQFGLPANVQRQYFDTRIPHNLMDEDFDESATELPAERPHTERTPALYTIVKSRLVVAFGDILAAMTSQDSPTYGEVIRLDKKLNVAHESIPPILQSRSFQLSVADPVELIMQRLWIELMYQKARIVLHRRYFSVARSDHRYQPSYFQCIDASMAMLQFQFDIHNEMQPGGRLSKERWFLSSLSTHDFLLADMMLCLELSQLLKTDKPDDELANVPEPVEKDKLLSIIRTSRNIWKSWCHESTEAMRAFKILSRMLAMAAGTSYEVSPEGDPAQSTESAGPELSQKPSYEFSPAGQFKDFDMQQYVQQHQQQHQQQQHQHQHYQDQHQHHHQHHHQQQQHHHHQHQQHQALADMAQHMGMAGPGAGPGPGPGPGPWPQPLANAANTANAPSIPPMGMAWAAHLGPVDPMAYEQEQILDASQGFDWATWDTQILNAASVESMENQWPNFFNRPA